ncbi:HNH endonuclease signature motif containing protein [Tritonibacter mobilis]|uniref:HNH endonuclease signature motif containing protein n=1 Tax=Tritonibacter mobilis TaxID=379347 RepID=UPI000F7DF168|nr:HNH endonuclease signature motif containing protein [Tritonibacter mobilis]
MKDLEYVRSILVGKFKAEHPHELPYPDLESAIAEVPFDYLMGNVVGETPNGRKSRDGYDYLWFQYGGKSILTHRFIAAVSLGKWVPRDFDIDHINHNPSDNRPSNLRVVTRRDNASNRRRVLISDLVDIDRISTEVMERKQISVQDDERIFEVDRPEFSSIDSFNDPIETTIYTGETEPAKHGGTWHKTKLGSWHLKFD